MSRITGRLQSRFAEWSERTLADERLVALYLDGFHVKVRHGKRLDSVPVLAAVGVRDTGERLLLHLSLGGNESTESWRAFVDQLIGRGLKAPKLVVIDGHKGLRRALRELWPRTPMQRCTVHKWQNLKGACPKRLHDELHADYRGVVYAAGCGDTRLYWLPRNAAVLCRRMARLARVVAVDFPHHVTQRGNRRQRTFFSEDHYRRYLELLAKWPAHFGLEVWAYCLMPNHVHLIVTPRKPESLARGIGEVHRRYTWAVNRERRWRGFLWQGRFSSYILGPTYLLNATRYALRNPVEARLARRPEDWRWSSARRLVRGEPDDVRVASPLDDLVDDWRAFLAERGDASARAQIERALRTGRPLADDPVIDRLELLVGRRLRRRKPGPKAKPKPGPKPTPKRQARAPQ